MSASSFHIINASAGSGKTFSLVLYYLKHLLQTERADAFKKMLALTFTNKAVNEMKERILSTLAVLSKKPEKEAVILQSLCTDLGVTPPQIQRRAQATLKNIINDYGAFSVITLDTFFHRLIRTFARDLRLPYGFSVAVDTHELLDEMVETMIDTVGHDLELTKILMRFNLYKVKEGRSWNVKKDLVELAAMLLQEKDRLPIQSFEKKPERVFVEESRILETLKQRLQNEMQESAWQELEALKANGLSKEDFSRGTLYTHFEKVSALRLERLYDNQLEVALKGEKPLYSKSLAAEKQAVIEGLRERLTQAFETIRKHYYQSVLSDQLLKHRVPLALLKKMNALLLDIEKREKKVLLSRFNEMIAEVVLNEPTPYIYERLGERYRHYFIDEFQDTSQLQWQNLIPLIANTLESEALDGERGSLLLVGDPKQAIYRWRGGYVTQFLELMSAKGNAFQVPPSVRFLPTNFRSFDTLVQFNNAFFKSCGEVLENPVHRRLFTEQSAQQHTKKGGYVQVEVIPKMTKEFSEPLHVEKTIAALKSVEAQGFGHDEIAILVRTKSHVALLANALTAEGYKTLSSESLTLESAPAVQFLLALFKLSIQPNDAVQHKVVLDFLWEASPIKWDESYHGFVSARVRLSTYALFEKLKEATDVCFDFNLFQQKQFLYEMLEYALYAFSFIDRRNAFVLQFLEFVFQISQEKTATVHAFLKHWEIKAASTYVTAPEGTHAVRILTIHKSKGLEFPVVILPFLEAPFLKINEKIWFPLSEHPFKEMEWGWIHYSDAIGNFGKSGASFLATHKQDATLDAFNVLYVAMTRAVEQLYVVTSKGNAEKRGSYADLFAFFINQSGFDYEQQSCFKWGQKTEKQSLRQQENSHEVWLEETKKQDPFEWKKKLVAFSKTEETSTEAVRYGLLLHDILGQIRVADEMEIAMQEVLEKQSSDFYDVEKIRNLLRHTIHHPQLNDFFNGTGEVFCESEILMPTGKNVRPDRVVKTDEGWCVMDYKTGAPQEEHKTQLADYAKILNEMGAERVQKYLVYMADEVTVLEV